MQRRGGNTSVRCEETKTFGIRRSNNNISSTTESDSNIHTSDTSGSKKNWSHNGGNPTHEAVSDVARRVGLGRVRENSGEPTGGSDRALEARSSNDHRSEVRGVHARLPQAVTHTATVAAAVPQAYQAEETELEEDDTKPSGVLNWFEDSWTVVPLGSVQLTTPEAVEAEEDHKQPNTQNRSDAHPKFKS
jgi:hypothetical protein